MEMTYREPQTPLFRECPCSRPATSHQPNLHSRIIRGSAGIVKKQARTTAKMADHRNKCNVPGCAGDVMWRDGLCLYSERQRKQITRSNKITRTTKAI